LQRYNPGMAPGMAPGMSGTAPGKPEGLPGGRRLQQAEDVPGVGPPEGVIPEVGLCTLNSFDP
jgi:hypothetical protein